MKIVCTQNHVISEADSVWGKVAIIRSIVLAAALLVMFAAAAQATLCKSSRDVQMFSK
ncbi:MAG: hypothetical protein WBL50_04930 [Candidatus Acidiferrum sp.]